MNVIHWLRENYGWKAKGKVVLFLVGAAIVIFALYVLIDLGV